MVGIWRLIWWRQLRSVELREYGMGAQQELSDGDRREPLVLRCLVWQRIYSRAIALDAPGPENDGMVRAQQQSLVVEDRGAEGGGRRRWGGEGRRGRKEQGK